MGACSSVGRAPDLHSGGRRFDSCHVHQIPSDGEMDIIPVFETGVPGSSPGWKAKIL